MKYSIGIDLGTTNSVISYVELGSVDEQSSQDEPVTGLLEIAQLTSVGNVEKKKQLPSFLYLPHDAEITEAETALPWGTQTSKIAGVLARELGAKTPIRLVSSAKSWLSHGGVDRKSNFLPLNSPEEVIMVSPLQASIDYLAHLKNAWNSEFAEDSFDEQEVIITIPASFDPAARDLTAEAARAIGVRHLTLLEEPQAAVYSWVKSMGDNWRDQVSVGDVILVVDIGGGTTDLSLVAVTEEDGNLILNRIAVGDHILLGGDNMDLALAYQVRAKLAKEGKNLQPWQIQALTHGCRSAKEKMLIDPALDAVPLVVPSRGSKLLGATLRSELTRAEVEQTLVNGFFPEATVDEHPVEKPRAALTQIGLPYAQDAGITRHIAGFLSKQAGATDSLGFDSQEAFIKPSAILFNGGTLKAPVLANRLLSVVNGWLVEAGAEQARLLDGADLDLAVAKGAAYFGFVKQGHGVRIRGGLASAYYIGVESSMPAVPGMEAPVEALCLAPFGMEEGTEAEVSDREFGLIVGQPVRFKFFGSTVRRDDVSGTLLDFWSPEELEELPEIQANLTAEGRKEGEVVPVRLAAKVTEIGTLMVEAIPRDGDQRWQVEFDVRD
mgnify:FL=1